MSAIPRATQYNSGTVPARGHRSEFAPRRRICPVCGFDAGRPAKVAANSGICSALDRGDRIISTHRGHGHCVAKGADLGRMMAERYGRQTGYCKGKGGSMHIDDLGIGMLGANGIVAG